LNSRGPTSKGREKGKEKGGKREKGTRKKEGKEKRENDRGGRGIFPLLLG